MKTDLSSPMAIEEFSIYIGVSSEALSQHLAIEEFSIYIGILSEALSQHHLSGFEIAPLESHHLH